MAVLIAHFGAAAVIRSLGSIGWAGFAAVCLIHLGLIGVMGIAWGVLMPGTRLWVPIWGRLVRDAGSELLPFSQVGGYVLGARAITFAGVAGPFAATSTIVDVTMELFGQLALTALALCWLSFIRPDTPIAAPDSRRFGRGGAIGLRLCRGSAARLRRARPGCPGAGARLGGQDGGRRGGPARRVVRNLPPAGAGMGQLLAALRLLGGQHSRSLGRVAIRRGPTRLRRRSW